MIQTSPDYKLAAHLEGIVDLGEGEMIAYGEEEMDEQDAEEGHRHSEDDDLHGHGVGEGGQYSYAVP